MSLQKNRATNIGKTDIEKQSAEAFHHEQRDAFKTHCLRGDNSNASFVAETTPDANHAAAHTGPPCAPTLRSPFLTLQMACELRLGRFRHGRRAVARR